MQRQILQIAGGMAVAVVVILAGLWLFRMRDETPASKSSDGVASPEAGISLLDNPSFDEDLNVGWLAYNELEPPGQAANALFDGQTTVVIDRSQTHWPGVSLGHAETGLVQRLDLDVQDYSFLELRAAFYIEEQSLARCGMAGSECPLMLRVQFIDAQGESWIFFQGFYAYDSPELLWPHKCPVCRGSHQQVSLNSWFTYESGNFFTLFPEERRPARIVELSFYASGHAYKVYVSEVNLTALH